MRGGYKRPCHPESIAVADPKFPRGGAPTPGGGDANLLFGQFSPKLHENEEILGQRGGGRGGEGRVTRTQP